MTHTMTQEHAARRYSQIAALERQLCAKGGEIATAQAHVKELKEEFDGLLGSLRAAARDEGAMPLFGDLNE